MRTRETGGGVGADDDDDFSVGEHSTRACRAALHLERFGLSLQLDLSGPGILTFDRAH